MSRRALALSVALALLATACTSSGGGEPELPVGVSGFDRGELLYGAAPTPNESVEYQDDVVIVGDGADAIRSMSADGLSWTIAGSAAGLDELRVGDVMFVTGRAVGRVLRIEDADDGDKAVMLGPVDITEVYRELDLEFEQPIDLASMPLLSATEMPGVTSEVKLLPETTPERTESTETTVTGNAAPAAPVELDPVQLIGVARAPGAPSAIAPFARGAIAPSVISAGDFRITTYTKGGVGVGLKYDKAGVRVDGLLLVRLAAPTLRFDLAISDGKVRRAGIEMTGAGGLTLQLTAASKVGLDNNVNAQLVIPVDISVPVAGLGVPFAITFSQRFLVKTAFSAKDSTLNATGDYGLSGKFFMGFDNGEIRIGGPTGFTVNKSLVHNIDGISVGVNGMVLAHAFRVTVGIGAFGFATGPYFDFITSFGITNGSDLGIVKCKGGSLDVFIAAGIGYQIPQAVTSAINFVLRRLNLAQIQPAAGVELGRTGIIHKEGITPISKICRE